MNLKLVYVKTPIGDEAIRQSTRVVQRNLRMVLVQVDGKLNVEELSAKIGNPRLVERALQELIDGGFIAESDVAVNAWVEGKRNVSKETISALSQFSTFGEKSVAQPSGSGHSQLSTASGFSSFGKPILKSPESASTDLNNLRPERDSADSEKSAKQQRSLLKPLMIGAFALLLGLSGVMLFYPYSSFKPGIEANLSGFLQTPVRIEQVDVTFQPLPVLRLLRLSIGENADSKIKEVRVASPWSLLFGGGQDVLMVEIFDASFLANRIVAFPMFGGAGASGMRIREIRIAQSSIVAGDLMLEGVAGKILFKGDGHIEKASFVAVDRSIQFVATPSTQGLTLKIEGLGWKPRGTPLVFASLQADGLLQKNKLLIQNLDTTFLGGVVKGNWLLDWSNGLVLAGDANLSRLDCIKIGAAFTTNLNLEGDLGGALHLRAAGTDWSGLWKNFEVTLEAEVTRGLLNGLDLGEVARRGIGRKTHSGTTKFDRLTANLAFNGTEFSARDIELDAGLLKTSGSLTVKQGLLEGNATVSIQSSFSNLQVPVQLSGTLPDIIATGRK